MTIHHPYRPEQTLRPFAAGDLEALHDLGSRPEVTRYLYWGPRSRAESEAALEAKLQRTRLVDTGDAINLAVIERANGAFVADGLLILTSDEHRGGEVGYIVHPEATGRGIATETARIMLSLGFEGAGLHRIIGRLDRRNAASARVLERLGMRREAHFVRNEMVDGEWTDEVVYAMLEEEWTSP